jgi:hypothetical protein
MMKNQLLFSLILVTTFILAGCTPGEAPPVVTPEPEPITEPSPTPEPPVEPSPTPEPTPVEETEGPPPTEADLSLYTEEEDRDAYLVIALDDMIIQPFQDEYAAALVDNAAWLQDPYAVATQFIDITRRFSDEPFPYEESFYLPALPTEAIFVIILGDYKDDSVWGNKIRVELALQDDVWEVVWAGELWRCRRGGADLEQTWHTTLCP